MIDQDVYEYILGNIQAELADEVFRSMEVMIALGYNNPDSRLIEVLSLHGSITTDELIDNIISTIRDQLTTILKEHSLYLQTNALLKNINEITSAVYLLQQLGDYRPIDSILNSGMDDETKLLEVLKYPSVLTDDDILESLDIRDSVFINSLNKFVNEKLLTDVDTSQIPDKELIENYKLFALFTVNVECTGVLLTKAGLKPNLPIESYFDYIHVDKGNAQDALNILSILLLSQNSYKYPLITYRKYASRFSDDLNIISKLDAMITHLVNDFEKFKLEQSNEKT